MGTIPVGQLLAGAKGDAGEPYFRRGASAGAVSVDQVQAAIDTLQKAARNALPARVVGSVQDLPGHLLDAWRAQGGGIVQAVYDPRTKAVYFVSEHIPSADRAVELWMHEQGAHLGLRGLFGERSRFDRFLDQVAATASRPAIEEIAGRYGLDLSQAKDRQIAAEEHLARIAEKVRLDEALTPRERTLWRRFLDFVRRWLRELGVNVRWTADELSRVVSESIRWTFEGERPGRPAEGSVAFARESGSPLERAVAAGRRIAAEVKAWGGRVDEFLAGRFPRDAAVPVGRTPEVLEALGGKPLSMVMEQVKLRKAFEKHGLDPEIVKRLPALLAEPVAVFDSATMANSFVVLTDAFDAQGRPVLAAVHLAVRHGRLEVNEIASIYGREDASAWLRQQIDARRVRYLDKKKAAEVQRSGRLQLPREMHRGGKGKILTEADVVKPILPEDLPGEMADSGPRFARAVDETAGAAPAEDGMELAADLEADRTFANQIHEARDVAVHQAGLRTLELQKQVQALAGSYKSRLPHPLSTEKRVKDSLASRALEGGMLVYRDLKINPAKAEKFEAWAAEQLRTARGERKLRIREQLDTLRLAKNLTEEQARFVGETMESAFGEVSALAEQHGVVSTFIDHYVRRIWGFPESERENVTGTNARYGFKVFTTASMQRTLETVMDGWMRGYDLKVKGVTNSYEAIASELATIVANKAFSFNPRPRVGG